MRIQNIPLPIKKPGIVESIEIRQSKKKLIPMLALMIIALIIGSYYLFFSGKMDGNSAIKIVCAFLTASLLYAIYISAKKFLKNQPVLSFSKSNLIVNEKGTILKKQKNYSRNLKSKGRISDLFCNFPAPLVGQISNQLINDLIDFRV